MARALRRLSCMALVVGLHLAPLGLAWFALKFRRALTSQGVANLIALVALIGIHPVLLIGVMRRSG